MGLGLGAGEFNAALAHAGDAFLNGRVSATLQIRDWQNWGSAGVCLRAHDPWCAVMFYLCTDKDERGTGKTRLILARYWDGRLRRLAHSTVAFPLSGDTATFTLWARSRALLGVMKSGDVSVNLEASDSTNCFAGAPGLVKFYRSRVHVRDFSSEVNVVAAPLPVDTYKWDALCSYASAGRADVKKFVEGLRAKGLRIWTDWDQIGPGDSIIGKIETGLAHSRRIMVCVTPGLRNSGWSQAEYAAFLTSEMKNPTGRVVPVVFPAAAPDDTPLLLRDRRFTQPNDDTSVAELCKRLREPLARD
jgi:hypothetical protein